MTTQTAPDDAYLARAAEHIGQHGSLVDFDCPN